MAYKLPTFNLVCSIYRNPTNQFSDKEFQEDIECQLRGPQKGPIALENGLGQPTELSMRLILPAGTDIRDAPHMPENTAGDFVDVPAGSGRFYKVVYVDDVAKGFDNEYRIAFLRKIEEGDLGDAPAWPVPYP